MDIFQKNLYNTSDARISSENIILLHKKKKPCFRLLLKSDYFNTLNINNVPITLIATFALACTSQFATMVLYLTLNHCKNSATSARPITQIKKIGILNHPPIIPMWYALKSRALIMYPTHFFEKILARNPLKNASSRKELKMIIYANAKKQFCFVKPSFSTRLCLIPDHSIWFLKMKN